MLLGSDPAPTLAPVGPRPVRRPASGRPGRLLHLWRGLGRRDRAREDRGAEQFPVAVVVGVGRGASSGILFKNAQAIDANHKVMWDDTAGSSAGVWEIDTEDPVGILAADVPATASYSVSTGPSVIGFEDLHQVFLGVTE